MAPDQQRLFRPTAGQLAVVVVLGVLALGYAFYMRYGVIQDTPTGLACDAGRASLLCEIRRVVIMLYEHSAFGAVAVGAALIQVARPTVAVFALGIIAAALGIVLYNVVLSGLAVPLLILSLARPATEAEPR